MALGKKSPDIKIIGAGTLFHRGEPVEDFVGFRSTPEAALEFQAEVQEELGEETKLIRFPTERTREKGRSFNLGGSLTEEQFTNIFADKTKIVN